MQRLAPGSAAAQQPMSFAGALRQGRQCLRAATLAAGAARRGGAPEEFFAKTQKLQAELEYSSRFSPNFSSAAGQPGEGGLVYGAKVTWADQNTLNLQRRAILTWEETPKCVLLVKKPGDKAASQKLAEIGAWLQQHGLKVLVERPVHQAEFPEFDVFSPVSAHAAVHAAQQAQQAGGGAAASAPTGAPGTSGPSGASNGSAASTSGSSSSSTSSSGGSGSRSGGAGPDLCITLGGDGTVLHLASLFTDEAPMPPVISFAMGTLGFLTPFNASMARAVLSRLLWPPWTNEPVFCTLRSRKQCEVWWGGQLQRVHRVLNECLVDRGASPNMVLLECFIDGRHLTAVQADALIISTPSGSTAYSMSAGGPMVAPSVPCTILTPVAPHSLSFRPIVVPESSVIEVHLPQSSRSHARASFDGRHTMRMLRDSSIVCRTSEYALPMINMHPLDEDWYEGITQKLKWTGSLRSQGGSRPHNR